MEITTRDQAITAGASKFFTGKLCKHGHVSERYVRGGGCSECMRVRNAEMPAFYEFKRQRAYMMKSLELLAAGDMVVWEEWATREAAFAAMDAERKGQSAETKRLREEFRESVTCTTVP